MRPVYGIDYLKISLTSKRKNKFLNNVLHHCCFLKDFTKIPEYHREFSSVTYKSAFSYHLRTESNSFMWCQTKRQLITSNNLLLSHLLSFETLLLEYM